jgi:dTDP-4-dehydrorhamnose reductase
VRAGAERSPEAAVRVLVTGARGMLGHAVVAEAAARGHDVDARGRDTLDITDVESVARALTAVRPDVVVNCAAWTDVDGAETAEEDARAINATGAGNLATAAAKAGAFLVHLSTDYVFDGASKRGGAWVESDPVAPLGAYGRTKLEGEQLVQAAGADHAIVRTAWLFGPGGRNFVDTMRRLGAERDELQVVADQIGCPTYTGHLAEALLTIAERRLTGIHHAAGRGACSWFDLALATFEATGTRVRVTPVTTEAFPRPAARPAWSVLGSERPDAVRLPDWREGLRAHLTTTATEVPA